MREQTKQERGSPPSWLAYFAVADADDAAHTVAQLGGRTLLATAELHDGRRFAIVTDPQGAAFAVFEGATDP